MMSKTNYPKTQDEIYQDLVKTHGKEKLLKMIENNSSIDEQILNILKKNLIKKNEEQMMSKTNYSKTQDEVYKKLLAKLMIEEIELILEQKYQTDLPNYYQEIKDKIHFIDRGKHKGKILIQSSKMVFDHIIKSSTDKATSNKLKWKLEQIPNILKGEDAIGVFSINGNKKYIRGLLIDFKKLKKTNELYQVKKIEG